MKQFLGTGRRKTSVASVRLLPGKGEVKVNNRKFEDYFPIDTNRSNILKPLEVTNSKGKYDIFVNVKGGGITGQTGAIQLGIARALVVMDEENKEALKKDNLLTRDARMVERKKYGLKKARKRFQFSKR